MLQNSVLQPKIVVIRRRSNQGFGFTLRHFIAYPPETWPDSSDPYQRKAMETIFIKEVHPNSPAHLAGLQTGDRVLMVNNTPVAGISYSTIVTMIKQTPSVLRLQVVPKECDVLQMYYTDIAHTPESNRQLETSRSLTHNFHLNKKMISMKEAGALHSTSRFTSEHSDGFSRHISSGEGLLVRAKPPVLSVLPNPNNETDIMVRLRKSIEQKEEFLKSPSYHTSNSTFSMLKNIIKPTPTTSGAGFYGTNSSVGFSDSLYNTERDCLNSLATKCKNTNIKDNFQRELLFLESLPDTGVTNKVFERKQAVSQFKVVDHFKPLPIATAGEGKSIFKSEMSKNATEYEQAVDIFKEQIESKAVEDYVSLESPLASSSSNNEANSVHYGAVLEARALQKSTEIVRRFKPVILDDNKPMRRISYLKATNNESDFHLETTNEFFTIEEKQIVCNEERQSANIETLSEMNGKVNSKEEVEVYEAELEVKSAYIYGKRSSDYRSWRQAKVELKGDIMKIYAGRSTKIDTNVIELNIRNFNVLEDIKEEKKKFVFKLQLKHQVSEADTAECSDKCCEYKEISFKTKNLSELKKWVSLLQDKACDFELQDNSQGKQLAEPQKTAAISSVPTGTYCDDNIQEYSPLGCSTTKCEGESDSTSFQSPVMKSRKAAPQKVLPDKDLGSPKSKNWKDLLFRRIHGTSSDIFTSNLNTPRPTGSIGVPLKSCPMSKDNEFVPHIVDVCTKIVESKGLNVVGIYRIPGNKAAISDLKEQVNRIDFSWDKVNTDIRWEDVNVVSSLLKLFIRSLPDALLPSSFYINFIEADKKTGDKRLKELKQLLRSLPTYSYETMKHIIRHLHRVSKNCEVNLMEPKNLAIIFGPSIIRTPNDTLEIAVKDMKHQCRIVELLVSQYEYFFENGPLPELECGSPPANSAVQQDQTSLLLDNVSKIEHRFHDKESMASRFIPHLRRRTHSKRSAVSSDTYSGESVLSLEYKKSPEGPPKEDLEHKKCERSSVDISILLTDEDSSNSRISDSGSMSLTTITDTLDSKLRNLRSGSESADENDSPNNNNLSRKNFSQPLVLHENIPYADESPERHLMPEGPLHLKAIARNPCNTNIVSNCIRDSIKSNSANSKFSSVYESCSDDSEVSTTSDPKESLIISPFFLERYKKRRDYKLFRSASFNCRNYSARHNSNLTKDEKTDMNITKKRQIQNKQNRSIKRRHTVGGPHDYSTTITRRTNNDHVLEVGIRIKNVNRRS